VIGIAQLLRESGLDARQKDLVDLIIESSDQQVAIISDLLDYSKIEAGQMSVDTTPFDLHALLAGAVATFRSQAWGKGLSLELDVDDSVPVAVASDPLKINQILTNLLSNAVKFTPSGGQVLVQASAIGTEVELSVADSGIGMSEEQIGIVLVPFSQGDASITRRYGGTGLGLAICKDLVDLLGGRLEFTSQEGEGSTFRVLLPFEGASGAATDTASGEPGHDFDGSDVLDVLVAEDNRVNARVITALLESSGCRPTVVPDGAQAVAEYTARAFDLVVLDLHMPVMDGISVAEFIRAHEREHGISAHQVVALTADVHEATRRRCMAAGFSEFLTKPVGKPEVLRMVARARELRLSRAAGQ
jgi:two-component system, sensor histidine kinase